MWRSLARLMAEDRVPGAVLVIGMAGLPASPYADAVADALLCDDPQDGRPCRRCAACRLAAAQSHPDRWTVADEHGQVRIDDVRQALAWAAYRPQRGWRRVVRLDGADRLGPEAAVAALKGVEEPGRGVTWILSATAPGRVPAAMRSRCVAFTLRPVPAEELATWLGALGGGEEAAPAAAAAGGLPGEALEALGLGRSAADEGREAVGRLRRRVRAALRAGTLTAGEARIALERARLAEAALRLATPARLVADALAEVEPARP